MAKRNRNNKKRVNKKHTKPEHAWRVYAVEWEEWDDPDFGPRHDGYSLHLSKEEVQQYIRRMESLYPPSSDISYMPLSVREIDSRKYHEMAREAGKRGKVAWVWSL